MTAVDSLTRDDLDFIRERVKRTAWKTPWLVDELVSRICLDLVRRPDLTTNHPLSQAVNMLLKSRLLDLLKQREQVPTGIATSDWDTRIPPSYMDAEEHEWRELHEWLTATLEQASIGKVSEWLECAATVTPAHTGQVLKSDEASGLRKLLRSFNSWASESGVPNLTQNEFRDRLLAADPRVTTVRVRPGGKRAYNVVALPSTATVEETSGVFGGDPERAARAAILLARWDLDHREIGNVLGVSRFVVSRDIARVRNALSKHSGD